MFVSVLILWQDIIGKQLSPKILEKQYVPQIASLLSVFVNSLHKNVRWDLVRIWWVFAFRDPQSLHQFICSFWVRLSKQGSSHFTCMSAFKFVFVFVIVSAFVFVFDFSSSITWSPFPLHKLVSCNWICIYVCLCLFFLHLSLCTSWCLALQLHLYLSFSFFFFNSLEYSPFSLHKLVSCKRAPIVSLPVLWTNLALRLTR